MYTNQIGAVGAVAFGEALKSNTVLEYLEYVFVSCPTRGHMHIHHVYIPCDACTAP